MKKDVEVIKAKSTINDRAKGKVIDRLRVAAYCRVSTDSDDQLNSYKSQVQYYTDMIKKKADWSLAGIYADEAITGTQVTKREDFQRLINDCMNGDVDMVITKSISRFARNTLDTLKYVRMLKEKNIAVFFEDEKINTLTMDGELLLVVLSSVAQQEVENISANVKKGLKMKMQRGELVGFQGCLGYDYDKETKSISVNEEEAEVVRYIFNRYIEGAGGSVIARELKNLGYKTKRNSTTWAETTVIGIIKNEKYKGDILMGKTFTVDPISKRRLDNFGEEDKFYIRDHHDAIISEETFEAAQEILKRRGKVRSLRMDGKREKFSRKYSFSCMLECGFCGSTLSRRSWHSGSQYNKMIWQCITATKKGKKFCPDSKGIAEEIIERAFVESYHLLCYNNKDVLNEFLTRTEETLSESNVGKQLSKVEKDIQACELKKAKLVDMRLEETIDKETYESKYLDLATKIELLSKERESLHETSETELNVKKRIATFRKTLENNQVLETFDRYVFESIIEKVIIGGYDDEGNQDPALITFIYKTGFKNSVDSTGFKPPRKNSKGKKQDVELCSDTGNEVDTTCSYHSDDTRGDGRFAGARRHLTGCKDRTMGGEMQNIHAMMAFIQELERLKGVLRSGLSSAGRRESTAEHSWRLALLAALALDEFPALDREKVLLMALLHDVGEAYEGDQPAVLRPDAHQKYETELQGAQKIFGLLEEPAQSRFFAIWQEYEAAESPEARLVKALDKAETLMQHNQCPNPPGFDYAFNLDYGRAYFEDSAFLQALRREIDKDTTLHIQ